MTNKENAEKDCCSGGCCGRGGTAIKALVLLLVGGVVGYLVGGHCGPKSCPVSSEMTAPASTPKK